MRKIAVVLLITFALSGLSMVRSHEADMMSGDMPAVQCLEHCLQPTGSSAVSGPMQIFTVLILFAAAGIISARNAGRPFSEKRDADPYDRLLRKRELAAVVLRN